jgi:hypothetical protein
LVSLGGFPEGQKSDPGYFVQNILPSLLPEKKPFSREKTAITFPMRMNNSIRHNEHRVVDELSRLKILRVPHPPYSPDISPCDFWMSGDFTGKLKDRHLRDSDEILTPFQALWDNITFDGLEMVV